MAGILGDGRADSDRLVVGEGLVVGRRYPPTGEGAGRGPCPLSRKNDIVA